MSQPKEKLIESYEKFAEQTKAFLNESKEKSQQALDKAMEEARSSLEKAGDISQEQGERFKEFLKRDLEQTAKDFKHLGTSSYEHLRPGAIKAGFFNLVTDLSKNAGELFGNLAEWAENEATFKTGEITGQAALECKKCGEELHFKASGHVPPCPKCHHTEFKRIR